MVCIRRSKLIYRYHNKMPCKLLVRPRRWSWRGPIFRRRTPCPISHNQPLTFILLQVAQMIEKVGKCPLLPTMQIHTQNGPTGAWYIHSTAHPNEQRELP